MAESKQLGGCRRCGARFPIQTDSEGNPVWTHTCPKTAGELLVELQQQVTELSNQIKELKAESADSE